MSSYLWGAIIFASVASVVCIVTPLIAAIEDDNRRFAAIMTVSSTAMVTLLACSIFLALHKKNEAREAPNVVPQVQIESHSAVQGPPEASA